MKLNDLNRKYLDLYARALNKNRAYQTYIGLIEERRLQAERIEDLKAENNEAETTPAELVKNTFEIDTSRKTIDAINKKLAQIDHNEFLDEKAQAALSEYNQQILVLYGQIEKKALVHIQKALEEFEACQEMAEAIEDMNTSISSTKVKYNIWEADFARRDRKDLLKLAQQIERHLADLPSH